ncbi:Hypothetical protein CINCED_3A023976 [Cinara cedri]|uniref:RING-type domain-containing protein n=1 Tax=Cinara cedri TaxID=506608 RepID=A0A5E4NF87_9HEMI|nr:Hypothetical protein CINCED_3A023976 [Cinara cedri]
MNCKQKKITYESMNYTNNPSDTMKQEVKNQDLNLKNEIIKIMNKELQCPICNEWLYKATSANCNHTFCEVCIRKWIQINKACPICRTAIQYTTTSIAVDNFISNLCQLFGGSVKEQRESIENARIDDADQTVDERISDLNQSIEEDTFLSQFETTMPPMRHPNMVPLIPLPRVTEVPVFTVNSREPLNLHHSNRGQLSSFIPIVLVDNLRVNDLQPTSNVDLHVSSSINQSIEEDTMISQLETTMPPMRHPNMVPLTPFPRVSEIHVSSSLQSSMELVTSLHNINHLQPTSSMSEVSSCVSSNFDQSVEEDI